MKLFTIGFTKKSAQQFFTRLSQPGLARILDVRLNNVSQLSGFSKRDDLKYFLQTIAGLEYVHEPQLAPTQEMLDDYKKKSGTWYEYEKRFVQLMEHRKVEETIAKSLLDGSCLLCSEASPHHCHRRLVAEYLQEKWGPIEVVHL
jgi:uncharacterized protein (DUF488 family)